MTELARPLRLGIQGGAVALVVGLLALLVWKVTQDDGGAAAKLASGRTTPAPAWTLRRLDRGGNLTLQSFRGKAIVLNFWASWCEPCKQEGGIL